MGSSVPAWPTLRVPSDAAPVDDVVRRHPGRLVDQQHAVGRVGPVTGPRPERQRLDEPRDGPRRSLFAV